MARPRRLPVPLPLLALPLLLATAPACHGAGDRRAKEQQAVQALERQAEACLAEGRYDCAMERYAAALKRRPAEPALLNRFAMAARLRYYVTGEADFRDQELDALRQAAKRDPRSVPVQVNFGTTCWELGLRGEAAEAYRVALKLAPEHPDAEVLRTRIARAPKDEEDEPEVE